MKSRENINYLVIGAGNILLSDEGIGIHIIKEMEKDADFSGTTGFIDIGTSTLDVGLYLTSQVKKIAVVDCIRADDFKAGTVFRLTLEDLRIRQTDRFSLHQTELVDSLKLVSIIDELPQAIFLGIVPFNISTFSTELSQVLKDVFPEIIAKVKKEILDFFKTDA
jgi:hydrogenase maturation protease